MNLSLRYSVLGAYEQKYKDVFTLIDEYYSTLQNAEVHSQMHHKLSTALSIAMKKGIGRQRTFERQLADSESADAVQMHGDMITANIWR